MKRETTLLLLATSHCSAGSQISGISGIYGVDTPPDPHVNPAPASFPTGKVQSITTSFIGSLQERSQRRKMEEQTLQPGKGHVTLGKQENGNDARKREESPNRKTTAPHEKGKPKPYDMNNSLQAVIGALWAIGTSVNTSMGQNGSVSV